MTTPIMNLIKRIESNLILFAIDFNFSKESHKEN